MRSGTYPTAELSDAVSKKTKLTLLALIGLVAVFLSACGADVDTIFKIDNAGAGTRTMTLTVDAADIDDNAVGGIAAVNRTLQANLPSELTMVPLAASGDSYVGGFTLTFDSASDYKQKVMSLLDYSGFEGQVELRVTVSDSVFISGVSIQENFTSVDLLQWGANSLIADGVVSEDNSGDIFGSSTTTVEYGGAQIQQYSNEISFDSGTAVGIRSIEVESWLEEGDEWKRSVTLGMSPDEYTLNQVAIDAYFQDLTDQGFELEDLSLPDEKRWTVTFTAPVDKVGEKTATIIDSELVAFEVEGALTQKTGLIAGMELTDWVECENICGDSGWDGIAESTLHFPTNWFLMAPDSAITVVSEDPFTLTHAADKETIGLAVGPESLEVAVDTKFGMTGSVTQVVSITTEVLPAEEAELIVAALESDLEGISVEEESGEENTVFRVTLSAGEKEYDSLLREYLPGSYFYYGDSGGLFGNDAWGEYQLDLSPLIGGFNVGQVHVTQSAPLFNSTRDLADNDVSIGYNAQTGKTAIVTVGFSGISLVSLIIIAVVIMLLLIAALLLVIFRRKIAAARATRREKKAQERMTLIEQGLLPPASTSDVSQFEDYATNDTLVDYSAQAAGVPSPTQQFGTGQVLAAPPPPPAPGGTPAPPTPTVPLEPPPPASQPQDYAQNPVATPQQQLDEAALYGLTQEFVQQDSWAETSSSAPLPNPQAPADAWATQEIPAEPAQTQEFPAGFAEPADEPKNYWE